MTAQSIWQVSSWNKTVRQAIDEFCRTYWAQSRKPIKMRGGLFQVQNGWKVYRCSEESGVYFIAIEEDKGHPDTRKGEPS